MVAAHPRALIAVSAITVIILVITIVAIVVAAHALLELRGLPVRAVAFALAEELEVAVEALEAGGAQCRRHLALQSDLGIVMRTAHGFGDRERDRPVAGVLSTTVGPEQGNRRKENRADLERCPNQATHHGKSSSSFAARAAWSSPGPATLHF